MPTSDETAVPKDDDGESWLELLRDGLDASVGKNLGKKPMGKLGKTMDLTKPSWEYDLLAVYILYFHGGFFMSETYWRLWAVGKPHLAHGYLVLSSQCFLRKQDVLVTLLVEYGIQLLFLCLWETVDFEPSIEPTNRIT